MNTAPIPQTDPRAGYLEQKAAIDAAIGRVLASGQYIMGGEVEALERAFAAWLGVAHAVADVHRLIAEVNAGRRRDSWKSRIFFAECHGLVLVGWDQLAQQAQAHQFRDCLRWAGGRFASLSHPTL